MFRSLGAKAFLAPSPVLLVGTYDSEGQPDLMTAAWGGICASQPPLLSVSVRRERWTHSAILARQAFTVGLPPAVLMAQTDFAGMHSGRNTDKFASMGFTLMRAEYVDAPYAAECGVVLELSLQDHKDAGSHTIFFGEIKDVKVREHCLNAEGQPDPAGIDPLVYIPILGEYWNLGSAQGRAYTAGKEISPVPRAKAD